LLAMKPVIAPNIAQPRIDIVHPFAPQKS